MVLLQTKNNIIQMLLWKGWPENNKEYIEYKEINKKVLKNNLRYFKRD